MTRSPSLGLAALIAAALLLPATSATAAPRAALVSPGHGAVVSSPIELRAEVTRDVLEPDARQVQIRLSADGSSAAGGSRTVSMTCVSGCGTSESVWSGGTYHPASAAPFGGAPACNGRWYLQVAVDGGSFGAGTPIVASAPASPASGVRVSIDGRDAVVTWNGAPEPDIAAYRVERRAAGGSWTTAGETGADAGRFVDEDVEEGSYEWRVVTLRPDGRTGGGAAAPCSDREPDLATTSSTTKGRVTEPAPSPSPSPTPTDDRTDAPDDDATTDPSPAEGEGDGGSGDGADGGGDGGTTTTDGAAPGTSAPAEPTADPAPVDDGGAAPAAAPQDPPAEGDDGRYYGEGQGVGLLDYGAAPEPGDGDATAAAPAGGTWVPGGVSVSTEQRLDRIRLLRPIAGGMVLLTFAFHIRRWQREQDV